jgi:hypothetical protein
MKANLFRLVILAIRVGFKVSCSSESKNSTDDFITAAEVCL